MDRSTRRSITCSRQGNPDTYLRDVTKLESRWRRVRRTREAHTSLVDNAQAALELARTPAIRQWLEQHPPQHLADTVPAHLLSEAILSTQTGRYLQSVLTLSGHKITSVEVTPGFTTKVSRYLQPDEMNDPAIRTLMEEGISPDSLHPDKFSDPFQARNHLQNCPPKLNSNRNSNSKLPTLAPRLLRDRRPIIPHIRRSPNSSVLKALDRVHAGVACLGLQTVAELAQGH